MARVPPTFWSRYQETEGVPGDMASPNYPDPVDALIANQLATRENASPALLDKILRQTPEPLERQLTPQEYIQQQFEGLK